ncbi:hypothetical protein [Streptomyces sp. NPDC093589]|uniref:hypothetical protein n=1 Tax=Streptomyces sp. NPDC093589 TaxID=3366043 RepID=UPI0038141684
MIVVRPDAYRQYMTGRKRFVLILEEQFMDSFDIEHGTRYEQYTKVTAEPGRPLADILSREVREGSDVLVIAEHDLLLTAPAVAIGPERTVATLRAGTGPLALNQVSALLEALEKTDPDAVRQGADTLTAALNAAGGLTLDDPLTGSLAKLTYAHPTWSWTDTGVFQPGVVQAAPAGRHRLSADGVGTVITGQIAVKGWPVVRSRTSGTEQSRKLFEQLTALSHYPLVLTAEDGTVSDLRAAEAGSAKAAVALEQLFTTDPGHSRVAGLEFGLNNAVPLLPFNSESNATGTGKATTSVHLVLGSLPTTPLQVVLPCSISTLTALDSTTPLAGAGTAAQGDGSTRPRRRMNRVTSAGCGCH